MLLSLPVCFGLALLRLRRKATRHPRVPTTSSPRRGLHEAAGTRAPNSLGRRITSSRFALPEAELAWGEEDSAGKLLPLRKLRCGCDLLRSGRRRVVVEFFSSPFGELVGDAKDGNFSVAPGSDVLRDNDVLPALVALPTGEMRCRSSSRGENVRSTLESQPRGGCLAPSGPWRCLQVAPGHACVHRSDDLHVIRNPWKLWRGPADKSTSNVITSADQNRRQCMAHGLPQL
jgi:hypothetical protein